MKRIVIVGFESAGLTAASAARMVDRDARITVIERRPYGTYSPCGIPFAIGGEIPEIKDLIEPPLRLNIDLRTSTDATSIDTGKRELEVEWKDGGRERIEYDALVLATGSYPFKPKVAGIELEGIHAVKGIEDGEAILRAAMSSKNAVVVGAGPIGIETSVALRGRGLNVTLVEALPCVLPSLLDPDMAEPVSERLREGGIHVSCGRPLEKISGEGKVGSVVAGGMEMDADLVILAVGARPEVGLAREAGIELGETGGIRVDERMRTSAPDVYAAGDCVETRCLITNRPMLSQLATTAIRMGRVAGANAAGADEVFSGVLNTAVTCAFDLEIASTGLTAQAAKKAGIEPVIGRIRASSRPRYYPGARPVVVKLVADGSTRRVIGGQTLGERAADRANLIALAIQRQMDVKGLSEIEYCYAPPVSDYINPIVMAAEAILRKL